tara:strand:- start:73 stop:411 length:339 start_codon:yes stop_codon:yes gene_type:complete
MTKNKKVAIQFEKGKDVIEKPEIRLFRSMDGKKGHAIYRFFNPSTITLENYKLIKRMYLIDQEGELSTRNIDLLISDDYIKEVKCKYSWNSEIEFERFMRFAERYSNSYPSY